MGLDDKNRPLYMISIAAELAGVHPQTLRSYEQKGRALGVPAGLGLAARQ